MECPYCKKEMAEGYIPETQGALLWWPGAPGERVEGAEMFSLWNEAVELSPGGVFGSRAEAWYCAECRTVILPVKEFETAADKIKKKLDGFFDRVDGAVERRDEARREEKLRKEKEKRRKKDPWEV